MKDRRTWWVYFHFADNDKTKVHHIDAYCPILDIAHCTNNVLYGTKVQYYAEAKLACTGWNHPLLHSFMLYWSIPPNLSGTIAESEKKVSRPCVSMGAMLYHIWCTITYTECTILGVSYCTNKVLVQYPALCNNLVQSYVWRKISSVKQREDGGRSNTSRRSEA